MTRGGEKGKRKRWEKLPDHSINVYSKSQLCFTDEQIRKLSTQFEFDDGYSLHQHLEDVALWYSADLNGPRPWPGEQRKLLEALEEYAEGLHGVLDRIGWEERRRLDPYLDPKILSDGDNGIRRHLRALQGAARRALRETAEPPSKADKAILRLVFNLRHTYVHGTGRREKLTANTASTPAATSGGEMYGGRFFDFVHTVLTYMNVPHTNQSLGERIREILPRTDEALD